MRLIVRHGPSVSRVCALFRLLPHSLHLWRGCGRADVRYVMANSGWSWHLFAAPAVDCGAAGTPVVVNYRGGEADAFLQRAGRCVSQHAARGALVLPSAFLLEVFARHGMDGRIVANIIDLERFHPDATPPALSPGPHLVVARNLEPIYGNDVALQAFAPILARFPGARLSVAG